jgi:hypothetical protein
MPRVLGEFGCPEALRDRCERARNIILEARRLETWVHEVLTHARTV